jgi:hybrid cluster-associated redox disulfide protein
MYIEYLLTRYPQAAQVFVAWRLACVGCWLACFHTLSDLSAIYNIDLQAFMADLRRAIASEAPRVPDRS